MKSSKVSLFLCVSFVYFMLSSQLGNAQVRVKTFVAGAYNDREGSSLTLLENGRFTFTWRFDLASSWTNGRWRISRDTVYLESVLVYDTVSFSGKDSLVLSADELQSRASFNDVVKDILTGGGQNRKNVPAKFCVKKGRLYPIMEGRVEKLNRKWYFTKKG